MLRVILGVQGFSILEEVIRSSRAVNLVSPSPNRGLCTVQEGVQCLMPRGHDSTVY